MADALNPTALRSAGVLLHPTSLPSAHGIGDLGPAAYAWVDALVRAEQTWWQILPLGPTGYGDSPYQSFGAFAGNPYLISPDKLIEDGLLRHDDCHNSFPVHEVDFGPVIQYKIGLLEKAWTNYQRGAASHLRGEWESFCAHEAAWLSDYSLFMALKDAHDGKPWDSWEPALRRHEAGALETARRAVIDHVQQHCFRQFLFFRQWRSLKEYANRHGVRLIGDVPIFVASDSADVWANAELFLLDDHRRPQAVAGVPPDYFSPTGQLWGNPLYDWEALRKTGYAWWVRRLRATLGLVDLVRVDHFRGFEAAWHVPFGNPTAERGAWVPGPGADLFEQLRKELGGLPVIAEDLGEITPPVRALRDQFHLPGMRILQFAFDKPENSFHPHNFVNNTVVYTGTHDNDTTRGWYESTAPHEKQLLHRYICTTNGRSVTWELIRLAWASTADYALVPLQDLLDLDGIARMNFPGKAAGNWKWRFRLDQAVEPALQRLRDLTELYNRRPLHKRAQ